MALPLVLDANVLGDGTFRHWLRGYRGDKILPAVAYAEFGVYVCRKRPRSMYDATLAKAGIEVEWLTQAHAGVAIETGLTARDWDRNSRDHLIAAHASSPPRLLVTWNVSDFRQLRDRVRTPAQLMAAGSR